VVDWFSEHICITQLVFILLHKLKYEHQLLLLFLFINLILQYYFKLFYILLDTNYNAIL